jgi:hypothetical protein
MILRWRAIASLAALGLLCACGPGGGGGASWDDPAGDVKPFANVPDKPRIDIVRVEANSGEGVLRLRIRAAKSYDEFFAYSDAQGKKSGAVAAEFFIDADDNAETGGHPTWAREASRPLRGYEYQVSIYLGWSYRDGNSTGRMTGDMSIDPKGYAEVAPLMTFGYARIKQGSDSYDFSASNKKPFGAVREEAQHAVKATKWKGDTLEAAVPYEWLGLKPGQTIRLCFKEVAEGGASGKGFSEDRKLKLR